MDASSFKKFKWANGQPAITIDPYDHSQTDCELILQMLSQHFTFERPAIDRLGPPLIPEINSYWAEFSIGDQKVILAMDEHFFTLAFQDEIFRDQVLQALTTKTGS